MIPFTRFRYNQEQAIKAALEMWDLGVDWIDIGVNLQGQAPKRFLRKKN